MHDSPTFQELNVEVQQCNHTRIQPVYDVSTLPNLQQIKFPSKPGASLSDSVSLTLLQQKVLCPQLEFGPRMKILEVTQDTHAQASCTGCKKNCIRRYIWKVRIDYCSAKNTFQNRAHLFYPFCCQQAQNRRQQGQVFSLKVEFILLATYTTRLANVFKSKCGILPTATFSHWQASPGALQLLLV